MRKLTRIVALLVASLLWACVYAVAGDFKVPGTRIDKSHGVDSVIPRQDDEAQSGYRPNGDGTVTDQNTGLIWQQIDDGVMRTWQQAHDYCERLTLGVYSDWRLPNRSELVSIVDFRQDDPAIDTDYFPRCRSSGYWSSSTHACYPGNAWYVNFYIGWAREANKDRQLYVRCVRGVH